MIRVRLNKLKNDSGTPEDINTIEEFCGLTPKEALMKMVKFTEKYPSAEIMDTSRLELRDADGNYSCQVDCVPDA